MPSAGFCRSRGPHTKNERERKDRLKSGHCPRSERVVEHEDDIDTIVNGALTTVNKELVQRLDEREIRGRIETIQTTALLRLARILRRWFGLVWFVEFYGISTFVGYLTPNPFL